MNSAFTYLSFNRTVISFGRIVAFIYAKLIWIWRAWNDRHIIGAFTQWYQILENNKYMWFQCPTLISRFIVYILWKEGTEPVFLLFDHSLLFFCPHFPTEYHRQVAVDSAYLNQLHEL